MHKKILITGCAITFIVLGIFASIPLFEAHAESDTRLLSSPGIGLYSDSACTQPLTMLNWGTVAPGDTIYKTIYIQNLFSRGLRLGMSTDNWNPTTINGAITLSWDQEGNRITAGQVVAATLTLQVSSNANGFTAFSVDITIRGTNNRYQG